MKKLTSLVATVIGLAVIEPSFATEPQIIQTQGQKAKGIWIDVRSAEEYQAGHLEGALNVPHTDIAAHIAKISPNKDEPINVYCRSGRRSELALNELKKLGYTNVTNQGGYTELLQKGFK